ncbi:MAG TPA: bifunctional diaminohydroxyphosphoribosylaminopyrimidine deaminase/5-amino-6-(5-phosphoribosylamino)uracil reductase RibD, partial [Prolixibacteraceae bacterium]|nr:bifunctional diaminohydroxyphosphoribosylaminopyrimidine deaminase/5-amino-6-(5-phosphoribosylamino)uracil reductase RibD [Prolixibacteraceae bacterium]
MNLPETFMQRCLDLALLGMGDVAPNPMVGCVIVHQGAIIGEGYHEKFGQPHAEVNAIKSLHHPELLAQSTLYVSLEPCAHFGKTPPCSDLIIKSRIPRVVIGTVDPFAKVSGKGIERMKKAGIEVEVGVLERECRHLNRRFFTFHEKKRPYILLKWAQTLDGFIDTDRTERQHPTWI